MTTPDKTVAAPSYTDDLKRLALLKVAADDFSAALDKGLSRAIIQGKALDDVLKGMLLHLSAKALETALTPLTDLLGSLASGASEAIGSGLSSLIGTGLSQASDAVMPFARSGRVSTPSYFPKMDEIGLAGEDGGQASMPLQCGNDGRLAARGSGGVAVTFNVSTPSVESFRQSEAQLTAMLARAVGRGRRGL